MIKCKNCDREVPGDSIFCPYCRLKIRLDVKPRRNLLDILKSRSNELALDLKKVRRRAEPLLAKINETFPDYTTHDIRHSNAVITIMSWLIPKSLITLMDNYELYFLLVAAYLHDIGMVNFPELLEGNEEFENFCAKGERQGHSREEAVKEWIRQHHHIRSEEFMIKNYSVLSLEDGFQARIIGRICRGHRDDLKNRNLYKNNVMYTSRGISINVCLLSAILRIADELDLTFERTPMTIYQKLYPDDVISRTHWERHLATGGVGLDPENSTRILISAQCKSHKIHRSLRKFETKIQFMLDELPDHLYQYKTSLKDIPIMTRLDIEPIGYKPIDMKFTLQEKKITELLMGEKIYERKDVFVRELLQNSIDSCRLKSKIVKNYEPLIHVKHHDGEIIVTDNGMGMNANQVERFFSKIGSCFYRSGDFIEEGIRFTPISQFGIGILSCYMVGDKMTIETKAEGSEPLRIEVEDIGDYFYITKGNKPESGTEVIVKLKPGEPSFDIESSIRYYVRHVEFPIEFSGKDKRSKMVRKANFKRTLRRVYDNFFILTKLRGNYSYDFYSIEFRKPNIEGVVALTCLKGPKGKLDLVSSGNSVAPKLPDTVLVSNEGIFVGDFPDLIPNLNGFQIDVNVKDLDLNLNIERTRIVQDAKRERLSLLLGDICGDLIDKFFHKISSEANHAKHFSLSNKLFDVYISPAAPGYLKFVNRFYYFPVFSLNDIRYLTIPQILEADKKIVAVVTNTYLRRVGRIDRVGYFADIFFNSSWPDPNALYIFDPPHHIFKLIEPPPETTKLMRMLKPNIIEDVAEYFLKSWKVVKYENYGGSRLIDEFGHYHRRKVYINVENRFADLLFRKGRQIISSEKRGKIVRSFFKQLRNVRNDLEGVINKQESILLWFKNAGLISDTKRFLLTKQDFPPHWVLT